MDRAAAGAAAVDPHQGKEEAAAAGLQHTLAARVADSFLDSSLDSFLDSFLDLFQEAFPEACLDCSLGAGLACPWRCSREAGPSVPHMAEEVLRVLALYAGGGLP